MDPLSARAQPNLSAQADQTIFTSQDPMLHHPHHDFPFSHAEAAKKQAEAMNVARAEALAQLEQGGQRIAPQPDAARGPRGTYDTSTSGPSFGHLLHQNGQPLTARSSLQGPVRPGGEMRGAPPFFRIPFGVPMGMPLPRPMTMMRTQTGMGTGLGLNPAGMGPTLTDITEAPESARRGLDERSAFMETVPDASSAHSALHRLTL